VVQGVQCTVLSLNVAQHLRVVGSAGLQLRTEGVLVRICLVMVTSTVYRQEV
jgi:hypothetical protein